jgi:hypothetical protein
VLLLDYCRDAGLCFWQTVPNLIEHEGDRGLVGNDLAGRRRAAYYDEKAPGPIRPEDPAPLVQAGFAAAAAQRTDDPTTQETPAGMPV